MRPVTQIQTQIKPQIKAQIKPQEVKIELVPRTATRD